MKHSGPVEISTQHSEERFFELRISKSIAEWIDGRVDIAHEIAACIQPHRNTAGTETPNGGTDVKWSPKEDKSS